MNILNETFTEEIKNELFNYKDIYNLSVYEYVNLCSLIITNSIITRKTIEIETINYFLNLILNKRNIGLPNDNSYVYNHAIKYIVYNYFKANGEAKETFDNIINNWFNGYIFNSLNDGFLEEINDNGLILKNKPWNIEDIKIIKDIFKGKKDIFGLSNGENNVVFYSTSLAQSSYYGLSSPTFYRKFIENKPKYLNTFLNNNLKTAYNSIQELCQEYNLTEDETNIVFKFFKKYWLLYANDRLPGVILKKRNKNINIEFPESNVIEYTTNIIIRDSKNIIIKEDIPRDNLIIFSYDTLSILAQNKKKLE